MDWFYSVDSKEKDEGEEEDEEKSFLAWITINKLCKTKSYYNAPFLNIDIKDDIIDTYLINQKIGAGEGSLILYCYLSFLICIVLKGTHL